MSACVLQRRGNGPLLPQLPTFGFQLQDQPPTDSQSLELTRRPSAHPRDRFAELSARSAMGASEQSRITSADGGG